MAYLHRPNIGRTLIQIHRSISRGINVSRASNRKFDWLGFPDDATREGFTNYLRSLASLMHGHHRTEDELAFPYFRGLLPGAPFNQLGDEHRQMVPLLDALRRVADKIDSPSPTEEPLHRLYPVLSRLEEIWLGHFLLEEDFITPEKAEAVLNSVEHMQLTQAFTVHSASLMAPDYLVVPFALYNLNSDDRAEIARELPPVVVQELVPLVWKERWETMRPFLLS